MNFNDIITEARKSGMSIEEIAKQFSETLNTYEQSEKKTSARKEILDHFEDCFHESYNNEMLIEEDAAALFALVMAGKHPEWTADNISEYFEMMLFMGKSAAETIGKTPDEALDVLLKHVNDTLNKVIEDMDKKEKKVSAKSKNDEETIKAFLKTLGL